VKKKRFLVVLLISLMFLTLIFSAPLEASTRHAPLAQATVINPDLTPAGGSTPHLAGGAWNAFDANQALPAKGGLLLAYEIPDLSAYPINTNAATVTLRPSADPASEITCTNALAPINPAPNELNTCYFQAVFPSFIQIQYLGNLAAGEDIAYSVSGLTSAQPASFVFADFDTTSTGVPMVPSPGRDPARLVLVLDKSGSMLWSSHPDDPGCNVFAAPPPGCEPARWDILNRAVTQMLAVGQAYALPDDVLAAALFDSTVAPANAFAPFDLNNTVNVDSFENHIQNLVTPGGGTSIGAGMTTHESVLTGADAADFNQSVLLFTDGDQNVKPFVVTNGAELLINADFNSPTQGTPTEFAPGVQVCPFALRADNPGGPLGTTYLQAIADLRCDGIFNATMDIDPDDASLVQFFLQVLHEALIGDKLELAAVRSGQMTDGGVDIESVAGGGEETFIISSDDIAFTLLITWVEDNNGLQRVELEKDGIIFTPNVESSFMRVDEGSNYVAITLRAPFCNDDQECVDPAGEWQLRMFPFFEVGDTFTYNVFVTTDNKSLANDFSVTQPTRGVGQPLVLKATLLENGAPLTGLPADSVKAVLRRPGSGLGNILSEATVALSPTVSIDPIAAAGLKAGAMLDDPQLRHALLAATQASLEQTLTLVESQPGEYTATYNNARVEGVYEINFFIDAETPGNGRFTRTFETGHYVPVVVDPAVTQGSLIITPLTPCGVAGGCFGITLRPADRAGNLLGPGKETLITLPNFEGQLDSIADNLDGTYTINISYPNAPTKDPVIDIFGVEVTVDIVPGDGVPPTVCVDGYVINHRETPVDGTRTTPPLSIDAVSPSGTFSTSVDAGGYFRFDDLAEGEWNLRMQLPDGWEGIVPQGDRGASAETGATTFDAKDGCHRIVFKIRRLIDITVLKWEESLDGIVRPGAGWTMTATPVKDPFVKSQTAETDADGQAGFALTPGHWVLSETVKPGWRPVTPPRADLSLDQYAPPGATEPVVFKNLEPACKGMIVVHKIGFGRDAQGAEVQLGPLSGWKVTLTRADGGMPPATDVTDGMGNATFEKLPPGVYRVTEDAQPGWEAMDENPQTVMHVACETTTITFRNRQVKGELAIYGRKLFKAWEPPYRGELVGLAGWEITARLVGTDTVTSTVTNGLGEYTFSEDTLTAAGMAFAGASVDVCEEQRDNWIPVTPACVQVTFPYPVPADYAGVKVDFVNMQDPPPAAALPGKAGPVAGCSVSHVVNKGQTLASIARHYGTTVRSLAQRNNIRDIDLIYTGQKLCIQ
jgi:hypothetical protein